MKKKNDTTNVIETEKNELFLKPSGICFSPDLS